MASQTYLRQRVKELKSQVFELEKQNFNKLYIYRTSPDWWRMGGNSALFYHYEISAQLNTNSTLRPDDDYYSTWQTGVVIIHEIDILLQKFHKAKLAHQRSSNSLIIVHLPHKFSKDDVERFARAEQAKADQFNKIITPHHIMPRINTKIDELSNLIANRAFQLPHQRYDLYGARLAELCIALQDDFIAVSNDQLSLDEYLDRSLASLNLLANHLAVAKKHNFCDNSQALNYARLIEFLRDNLPKEVKRMRRRLAEQGTTRKGKPDA